MKCRKSYIVALLMLTFSLSGKSDETITPLAEDGDWVASAHHASITAPPDVCLAMDLSAGIFFRASDDGIELRVADPSWSLPVDVQGTIVVKINQWEHSFDIGANTSNMVSAPMTPDLLTGLFAEMDKASDMSVVIGKAPPFSVSLSGSTKVTNAFLTCAGIKSGSVSAGSNPFQ